MSQGIRHCGPSLNIDFCLLKKYLVSINSLMIISETRKNMFTNCFLMFRLFLHSFFKKTFYNSTANLFYESCEEKLIVCFAFRVVFVRSVKLIILAVFWNHFIS